MATNDHSEGIRLQSERVVRAYKALRDSPSSANFTSDDFPVGLFAELVQQIKLLEGWLEPLAGDLHEQTIAEIREEYPEADEREASCVSRSGSRSGLRARRRTRLTRRSALRCSRDTRPSDRNGTRPAPLRAHRARRRRAAASSSAGDRGVDRLKRSNLRKPWAAFRRPFSLQPAWQDSLMPSTHDANMAALRMAYNVAFTTHAERARALTEALMRGGGHGRTHRS